MNTKYLLFGILSTVLISGGIAVHSSAQEAMTVTASIDATSPGARSIGDLAQSVDVAHIRLTSNGSGYVSGVYLTSDVAGGLSNFTNVYVYDISDPSVEEVLLGTYSPFSNSASNYISFSQLQITPSLPIVLMIRASLTSSAAGNVRVGFSGFTFSAATQPNLSGVPVYGNVMTLPGTVASTPVPTATPSPSSSPSSTPNLLTPSAMGFTTLSALGLSEGDTISAAGSDDPDIYIANEWGYKRLFLNPVIFSFYGHLGGFAKVKNISASTRNMMVTSGLFRNCETNDTKVYGVESTGEDTAVLHWVNTTGAQAVADDPNFFKKVFCINSAEFNWYAQGSAYTSVNQVPGYFR
jgi:hypothetical protein